MIDDEFFPPPECPVFEPNEDEFADPLGYINKIRPIAEKAGICKIRPPPHWQPPFAIDVENFKFTPRVQRINELGIHTRIRLQFIESVAKFWDLQGNPFKLPHVGGKALDLYGLHKVVESFGGFQDVCKNKQWNTVCGKLRLQKNFSTVIRQHYERILYPYDIMKSGVLVEALESGKKRDSVASSLNLQFKSRKKTMYQGSNVSLENLDLFKASQPQLQAKQRSKRRPVDEPLIADVSNNKELAKLQLYGSAGPKMVGLGVTAGEAKLQEPSENKPSFDVKSTQDEKIEIKKEPEIENCVIKDETNEIQCKSEEKKRIQTRTRGSDQIPYSIIDSIDNCKLCGKDSNDSLLLLCEGCDDSYHTYCLIPPLPNVPAGDWRCPKCIAKECNKQTQAYGFEQARKEYTLQSFGEMADAFKSEYFTKPVHMVPTDVVEQEFWRLVGSLEEDLAVEYGADIHVIDNGSGFPRMCDKESRDLTPEEEEYAKSKWNLNNLPVQEQSLLRSISGDISGMKIPWVYVGMCFSAFCWHIEDHWTYSINYLHWGEPKTWYGVPREDACKLEIAMQESAPELFKNHPDLLHHLVTTMNPATLMKHGVRVVRTNQCAGEFMITFPRAYHAGFNQGYNFAEAVNFCPADWVPVGRQCVAHYRKMKKPCVFSHEEIVCKVANNPEKLDVQVAAVIYKDMLTMLQEERESRKHLIDLGIVKAEREAFELVPDDERQCMHCRTTCFLSGITCSCSPDNLVCLRHVSELCTKCASSEFVLRYRYSLDELPPILHKLKARAEAFDTWGEKVKNAFNSAENKLSLQEMKSLLIESENGKFPENDLLQRLKSVVHEAEICLRVARQLVNTKKHRTRIKDPSNLAAPNKCTLALEEIQAFCKQIKNLPCAIPCIDQVYEYTEKIERFIKVADEGINKEEPSSAEIMQLLEDSTEFDLDLPQIPLLHKALRQAKWLEEVRERLLLDVEDDDVTPRSPVTLEQLRSLIDDGVSIPPRRSVERAMAELQELLTLSEGWEEKAKMCLNTRPPVALPTAMLVTEKASQIPVHLPQCLKLGEVVKKAKLWIAKVEKVQTQDYYPYVEVLEALSVQARMLAVKLDQATQIESQVESAKAWKERTSKIFLKKNTLYSLFQALKPRSEEIHQSVSLRWRRKKLRDLTTEEHNLIEQNAKSDNININNPPDPVKVVASFKNAEKREIEMIRRIRDENDAKSDKTSSRSPSSPTESNNSSDGKDEVLYCVCRKPTSGLMLQCEVCHDWFHTTCVPLPKLNNNKSRVEQVYDLKFLCPLCHRTRRPHLAAILNLLLQLQKLPVRIEEGEALQCLTERAMAWQDRARKVLSSEKYQEILKQACQLSGSSYQPLHSANNKDFYCTIKKDSSTLDDSTPAHVGTEGRNSIDEAIDAVIEHSAKRAAEEEKKFRSDEVSFLPTNSDQEDTKYADVLDAAETLAMISSCHNRSSSNFDDPGSGFSRVPSEKVASDTKLSFCSTNHKTPASSTDHVTRPEHCSTSNNIMLSSVTDDRKTDIKVDHKTHLVTKTDGDSSNTVNKDDDSLKKVKQLSLTPQMKSLFQELMLEGDLLEVTLPETQLIWKILQASQPRKDENFLSLLEEEKKSLIDSGLEKKRKKHEASVEKRKKMKTEDKEKKLKMDKKKKKNEVKQTIAVAELSSAVDDDEYAFCSVELGTGGRQQCLQPVGEEVNWVQCDGGCEEWFHCVCVNVTASEARECDYVCEACRKNKSDRRDEKPIEISNMDVDVVMTTDIIKNNFKSTELLKEPKPV